MLEGLEIDQYMWEILTKLNNTEVEEVTIDASAQWKPVTTGLPPIKGMKEEDPGVWTNKQIKLWQFYVADWRKKKHCILIITYQQADI